MFKKFTSMMTAAILLATGLTVIGTSTAMAVPSANLSALQTYNGSYTSIPNFSPSTTTYNVSTSSSSLIILPTTEEAFRTTVETCNGTVISSGSSCSFNVGANVYTVTVTASDNTTKTYTINFTYTAPAAPAITSTSTISVGQVNPSIVIQTDRGQFFNNSSALLSTYGGFTVSVGTTGLTRGASVVSGAGNNTVTVSFSGTASAGTLTFKVNANILTGGPETNTLSFVVSGGSSSNSSQTAEQIAAAAAAAAKAAAEAAAAVRAAEIATAQTKLATALKGDKPGSIDDFKAANINVTTAASLARINAEVLKLSAADRADFAKIKAIADKIEFDESFFNATARPTVATYNAYGVTVTDRTVATINAKVLELPVSKRTDVTVIAEIAKVETFVDRVANPATRLSVPAATLVSKGLLSADSPYKYSVVQGLAMYPEGSLNSMAKIEAAIKAEIVKAGARKAKTEAIKAKIAARKK